jgi:ABC-type uncharacterized transport system substrate-binding protein
LVSSATIFPADSLRFWPFLAVFRRVSQNHSEPHVVENSSEAAAPSFAVKPIVTPVHDAAEIERVIATAAQESNTGLIVVPSAFMTTHRELVIGAAARDRLPAVYGYSYYAASGGLVSYGFDVRDLFRRAASYVDRILKGAKPADLPVQAPVKFELVVNLRAARVIGVTVPPAVIARADEVIE